jgi:hypothetical protein
MCLIWLFASRELCLLLDLMGSLRLLFRWGIDLLRGDREFLGFARLYRHGATLARIFD